MKRRARTTEKRIESDSRREENGAAEARSRRDFMRLMAAGGAALIAAPAAAAVKAPAKKPAADTTRTRRTRGGETVPTNGVHPMLPAELEKQKKFTAESLKTLRNYSLPPGATPAYVFRPLAQKSRRGRS